MQFCYKVQDYANTLLTSGRNYSVSHGFNSVSVRHSWKQLQDILHLMVLSLEYLKHCEMRNAFKILDIYGAECHVGLISTECRKAGKFLGSNFKFFICFSLIFTQNRLD